MRGFDPKIVADLRALVAEGPAVAVFDWDNTCMEGDVTEVLLEALAPDDLPAYRTLEAQDPDAAYAWLVGRLGAGHTLDEVQARDAPLLDAALADGRLRPRPAIQALLGELRAAGWRCWVVSCGFEPPVRALAQRYGFEPDQVVGARLRRVNGRFVGELDGPLPHHQGKRRAIERFIGERPKLAMGDADSDLEMLAYAEHAVVIDRGQPALSRAAQCRGWWVQRGW